MEINTQYGYPLLTVTEADGCQRWYLPKTGIEYGFRVSEPSLIPGTPAIHISDGFKVCIFTPMDETRLIPTVLSIVKL